MSGKPALGSIVLYRGQRGVHATLDTLKPANVAAGAVPALDSAEHAHLWVFTPGGGPGGEIPPGSWCWPSQA